jgi:cytochrome c-type biogenesis protein CcmH/NrfG
MDRRACATKTRNEVQQRRVSIAELAAGFSKMRRSISTRYGVIAPGSSPGASLLVSVPIDRHPHTLRRLALSAPLVMALLTGPIVEPGLAQTPRATTVPIPPTEAEEISRMMREKDLDGALKRAEVFLVKNPRDLQVRFLRGVILSDQNKTADAVAAFEALTQDFPELPEPYNNLAVLHANQGELDLARSLLQQAIIAQPNYGTAYENLGDVYVSLAAEAYQRALKLDPNNRTAQSKLSLAREISAKLRAVR